VGPARLDALLDSVGSDWQQVLPRRRFGTVRRQPPWDERTSRRMPAVWAAPFSNFNSHPPRAADCRRGTRAVLDQAL